MKIGLGRNGFRYQIFGNDMIFLSEAVMDRPGAAAAVDRAPLCIYTCTAPMKIKPVSLRQQQQQSAVVGSNFSLLYTLQINRLSELIIRFDVRPSTSPTKFF